MIIDGHIHATYWSKEKFLGRGVEFSELERCLETCGMAGAVLTCTDLRRNDLVLDFIKNRAKGRYWFFPWVKPGDVSDMDFVENHLKEVNGIKLHPSCDAIRVTDPRAKPVLEFASANNLPVMIHCGRWQEMSSYTYALEVASTYVGIPFILSHMGGDTPELEMATIADVEASGLNNVYLGIEGVREYWAIEEAVRRLGAQHVIFGSDYPLGHPKMYLGLVDALNIDDEERALILGGNILRLLGEGV